MLPLSDLISEKYKLKLIKLTKLLTKLFQKLIFILSNYFFFRMDVSKKLNKLAIKL